MVVLAAITGLAAYFRLYGISWLEPIGDEYAGLEYATLPLSVILGGEYDPYHPVLYFSILHVLTMLFGKSILTARILSAGAGILTVPLLYLFASRLFDNKTGLFAALLLAVSTIHVVWSHYARMYSLLPFFTLLVAYTGLMAAQRRDGRGWIFFVLSGTLLLYTHYFGAVFFLFTTLALLAGLGNRMIHDRKFLISLGTIFLLFLPQVLVLLGQEGVERRYWQDVGDGFTLVIRTFLNFLPAEQLLRRVFFSWILLALLIPVIPLRTISFISIPALLPAPAAYYFSQWISPIYWDRYLVSSVPFLCLLAALGLKAVIDTVNRTFKFRAAAAPLSFVILLWSTWLVLDKSADSPDRIDRLHSTSSPFSEVTEYIYENRNLSRIIFTSESMPYVYLLGDKRFSIKDLAGRSKNWSGREPWNDIISHPWFKFSSGRFWVVLDPSAPGAGARGSPFMSWLTKANLILEEKQFDRLHLYLAEAMDFDQEKLLELHDRALENIHLEPLDFGTGADQLQSANP